MDTGEPNLMHDNSYETSPLEHIAQGVEIRYDLLMGYTEAVIESTAVIARDLGVPDEQILTWVKARQERSMSRISRIYSLLDKLECNLRAQVVLGLTRPYQSAVNEINRGKQD
jgi:hypothetical protein